MLSDTAEAVSAFADVRNTGQVMPRALLMILEILIPLSNLVTERLGKLCTCFVPFCSFPWDSLCWLDCSLTGNFLEKKKKASDL